MPNIADLPLSQLRLATKAQIITAISNFLTNNFTKRQLITFLLDAETVADPPVRSYGTDGQIESETVTERDAETAAVITTRQIHWSYYPTGEVDTITITEGDALRTIKHYLDGQQPTVTIQAQPRTAAPIIAHRQPPAWWKPVLVVLALLALAFLTLYFSRGV